MGVNKVRKEFYRCRQANRVMLLLKNAFNYQFVNYNVCFSLIFVNGRLGYNAALCSVHRLFCPVLTFERFELWDTQGIWWDGSSNSILKQLHLLGFFFFLHWSDCSVSWLKCWFHGHKYFSEFINLSAYDHAFHWNKLLLSLKNKKISKQISQGWENAAGESVIR